jgi:predicted nucleic-acid-binding Zn-ribbon protein
MVELSPQTVRKIAAALEERGASLPCPRCGNAHFIIADGFFMNGLQRDFSGFSIGGPSIPTVVTVCSQCGYISQHAVGILGLLENPFDFDEESDK